MRIWEDISNSVDDHGGILKSALAQIILYFIHNMYYVVKYLDYLVQLSFSFDVKQNLIS